ncbi:MAG: diacylglycerol kinase family protein [Steroidobacteraceae bacterium]
MSALPSGSLSAPIAGDAPCLILNPRSFLASRGRLASRVIALAARYGTEVIEASSPAQLNRDLDALRARKQSRIFILAGDGTIQGLVQYLALLPTGTWSPELLLLGGGRSNLVANDLGGAGTLPRLERALRRGRDGASFTVREQQLLRVEHEGSVPHHGFFLAGSRIDSGIRLCHQHRLSGTSRLHKGRLSSPYCLLKLAVKVMIGRSPLPPYPDLQIRTDTSETLRAPSRVFIVTTLHHRESLYNPYAARGTGAVRVTAISATAPRFWRRLPTLLAGRFDSQMNSHNGYLSGRFDRLEVLGLASYALDGEMFDVDPTKPVIFRGGQTIRCLQP